MTSRVTVRIPPELIESARAVQYANRRRLAARDLEAKIIKAVKQRVDSARRAEPLPDDLVGGQLEFTKRKKRKIEVRRRRPRLGFLLIPSADYDNQLRLPVLTEYGGQQYAVTPNAVGTQQPIPFELVNGKLMAKVYPPAPNSEGQYFLSGLRYDTPPIEEVSSVFTVEFMVSLDAGAQQQPLIEYIGNGIEKLTEYDSSFGFFVEQGATSFPLIQFNKGLAYADGRGLRQSWGLGVTGDLSQDILLTPDGGEYHVAMVQSGNTLRIYFAGSLVRTLAAVSSISTGTPLESVFDSISFRRETLRFQGTGDAISRFYYADTPRSGFRCYRFTPGQALYAGDSFTPPTSITDLA
jgi:hypothetical protein